MSNLTQAVRTLAESDQLDQFRLNAQDFLSARESGASAGTQIAQMVTALSEAAQTLNRSFPKEEERGQYTNVISPVVVPKDSRSYLWLVVALFLFFVGAFGLAFGRAADNLLGLGNPALVFFGPHYWLVFLVYVAVSAWQHSYVMIPDGCQALITKFGKVEKTVGPGRTWLIDPRKKVSYVVNTTKEYPYNAPIRRAPTRDRVDASVDLFLQFRIEEPGEFIFRLGGVNGFSEKLQNAISEVTRALIYEQEAEAIYDLVGESTQSLLETLNSQFLPAVRFVNANITHAEPSSQEYRMDLAAAEMVRVAKEAYTYQYELELRKHQDTGDLNKELATLRETLSAIRAEIATFQAQIDTAREKAVNRANAYARQLMIEAESEARANAALLKAQSLDIKAVNSATYPEILEYRYRQQVLDSVEGVAGRLPQVVNVGPAAEHTVDFMALAQQMMGITERPLYSGPELEAIRKQINEIARRIRERSDQIKSLINAGEEEPVRVGAVSAPAEPEAVLPQVLNSAADEEAVS
jgi:regulator of protease activity HflC (stomatin/prohibitin superfamily)